MYLILCDPMDFSPQGSSVHGIFQARIVEWVLISFCQGSSPSKDWTCVTCISLLAGGFFITSATWEAKVKVLVTQSCPTLWNPMDCSPPGSSVHGICQARILQWVQFSSVAQSCPTLCNPMNRSTPGLPVHHQLLKFTQTHVHRVADAIQPSHPLSSPSPPAPNPSQHQGLFQWVNSSHEVAKVLEFQLQHQSFQWTAVGSQSLFQRIFPTQESNRGWVTIGKLLDDLSVGFACQGNQPSG